MDDAQMSNNKVPVPAIVRLRDNWRWVYLMVGQVFVMLSLGVPMLLIQIQNRSIAVEMLASIRAQALIRDAEIQEMVALKSKLASIEMKVDVLVEQTRK